MRTVTVDIDEFAAKLSQFLADDEPWDVEQIFDESGLSYEGIDKIIGKSKEVLELIGAGFENKTENIIEVKDGSQKR